MLTAAFFIGIFVAFSKLAELYHRTKWKAIITGFLVFFGTQILVGFMIGFYQAFQNDLDINNDLKNYNSLSAENLIILVLSLLLTYLYYNFLKKKFIKEKEKSPENEIKNIGEKQD